MAGFGGARRNFEDVAILQYAQDRPVGVGTKGPLPIVVGLVGLATLRGEPGRRIKQGRKREIDDGGGAGMQLQVAVRGGEQKGLAGAHGVTARGQVGDGVAAMLIGKGGGYRDGVLGDDLHERPELHDALRIPDDARDGGPGAGTAGRMREGGCECRDETDGKPQKKDEGEAFLAYTFPGSWHSVPLRVEGISLKWRVERRLAGG